MPEITKSLITLFYYVNDCLLALSLNQLLDLNMEHLI